MMLWLTLASVYIQKSNIQAPSLSLLAKRMIDVLLHLLKTCVGFRCFMEGKSTSLAKALCMAKATMM